FGWPAKVLFLATFAFVFAVNWRRVADSQGRLLALAGAAAVAAIALLLPTGASAALVLLALAYTLGSRSLAAIGALAEVYFIWRFYADLQDTLLTKSIILMSAGEVLLLELRPADPRSLFQGDYMALALADATMPGSTIITSLPYRGTVVLSLDENRVGRYARLDDGTPLKANEMRVQYRRHEDWRG